MANDLDLVKMFSELTPDQARELTQRIRSAVQTEYFRVKRGSVPAIVPQEQQNPLKASRERNKQAEHNQRLQHG